MPDAYEAAEAIANGDPTSGAGAGIIGTPDDAIERIRALRDIVGGFGVVLGFAHDWASREATLRSWELFARYVVPEINGYLRPMRDSAEYVSSNKGELMAGAVGAIMEAIGKHKGAAEAAAETARLVANAGPPSPVR
jgi:limonene 1,2-monooxygenase